MPADAEMTLIMPAGSGRSASAIDSIIPPVAPLPGPAESRAPGPVPRGSGRLLGLTLGALAVIGGGAYAMWTHLHGKTAPAPETPAMAGPPAAAPAAPPGVPVPAPLPAPVPAPAAESAAPPLATPEPVPEPTPIAEPPKPSAPGTGEKAQRSEKPGKGKKRETAEAERRPLPKPAPEPPAPEPRAPEARVAPVPQPAPESARWANMQEELKACGTFNLFCREKVRWKYCAGRWGTVPQCPPSSAQSGGG
jgi:hypothetical protein